MGRKGHYIQNERLWGKERAEVARGGERFCENERGGSKLEKERSLFLLVTYPLGT